jgi:predicted helicase
LQTGEVSYVFPLYLYSESSNQKTLSDTLERIPNLNPEILKKIEEHLGLAFIPEKNESGNVCMANNVEVRDEYKEKFAPINLLDYIYAVLHSPTYRDKYKEFLKIDFPRVPYPEDQHTFWQLVELGFQLRQLHLMESPKTEEYITTYPKDGSNEITTKIGKKDWELFDTENQLGRIWINDTQNFDNIPLTAWEFYIGGYQPAQKWLKDRKGRTLDYDDILHYQKIIVVLSKTNEIMNKIDEIEIE